MTGLKTYLSPREKAITRLLLGFRGMCRRVRVNKSVQA